MQRTCREIRNLRTKKPRKRVTVSAGLRRDSHGNERAECCRFTRWLWQQNILERHRPRYPERLEQRACCEKCQTKLLSEKLEAGGWVEKKKLKGDARCGGGQVVARGGKRTVRCP